MKLNAMLLACSTLLCTASFAQQKAPDAKAMKQVLGESIREKIRSKPVKISDMLAAEQRSNMKSTAAASGRVSNNTAISVDEAEVHIAINPVDSNKMVVSFMQQTTGGLTFPVYYSGDAGMTWTKSSFNPVAALSADFPGQFILGGGDPVFAWSKTGKLYYSWIYLTSRATF